MADADRRDDRIDRLRLIRSANIGPVTYAHLIARFGTAGAALDALPDLARRGGGRDVRIAPLAGIEREIAAVDRLGARYLFRGLASYPALLDEIESAPPALITWGDTALLDKPAVAVVGARNASASACRYARGLCRELAEAGVVVVSGLARGIDTAAHLGALDGGTIGVIAGGIDIFYPPENEGLQREIAARGLVIAEQPPGTEPRARHFPYRNRIIAGLAQATVVVEAAPKSGSLITARLANEFGRDVLAVPGSPLDSRAQGCNLLIREGATLIQTAADVLEALRPFGTLRQPRRAFAGATLADLFADEGNPLSPAPPPPDALDLDDRGRGIVESLLGPSAVLIDEVIRLSELPAALVQMALLELELGGRLERHAGGKVSLA